MGGYTIFVNYPLTGWFVKRDMLKRLKPEIRGEFDEGRVFVLRDLEQKRACINVYANNSAMSD